MNVPVKRKKTKRKLPINVGSLFRKHERGDKRIDIVRLIQLLDAWEDGENVPWRTIGPTLIKSGRRPPLPQ